VAYWVFFWLLFPASYGQFFLPYSPITGAVLSWVIGLELVVSFWVVSYLAPGDFLRLFFFKF
jgi:hypothetical protein